MVSLLLLLSFLIHLILFIIIFKLFDQIQQLKAQKTEPFEQLEATLKQFLEEIREENKQLEMKLKDEVYKYNYQQAIPTNHEHVNDKMNNARIINKVVDVNETINKQQEQLNYDDVVETSFESKVLQLHSEGKTIEEIARKLNRGKTEIELLIKLNKSINT